MSKKWILNRGGIKLQNEKKKGNKKKRSSSLWLKLIASWDQIQLAIPLQNILQYIDMCYWDGMSQYRMQNKQDTD